MKCMTSGLNMTEKFKDVRIYGTVKVGEKGQVVVQNPKPDTTVMIDSKGYHTPPLLHFFIERYSDAYVAEMKSFIAAILNDRHPAVTSQDGLIAVQMAIAARKSLVT